MPRCPRGRRTLLSNFPPRFIAEDRRMHAWTFDSRQRTCRFNGGLNRVWPEGGRAESW